MLNITNYQRNANQNNNEISYSSQNGHNKSINSSAGEDVEQREPLHTVGENVDWHNYSGKQYGGSWKN